MSQQQTAQPELAERDASETDFAQEHATAGFKACLPVTAGLDSLGAVEGLDPDQSTVLRAWQRRLERRPRAWMRWVIWLGGSRGRAVGRAARSAGRS